MKLYAATDLHSSNNYLAIIDEHGERRFKQKLPNNPSIILEALMPYKEEITGIVVESTYNWYWLVDMLMAKGYKVHLAGDRFEICPQHKNTQVLNMRTTNTMPFGLPRCCASIYSRKATSIPKKNDL